MQIHIVFFINCCLNQNYQSWFSILKLIQKINYTSCQLVCIVDKTHDQEEIEIVIQKFLKNYSLYFYFGNSFEYHGISHIWQLGQIYSSKTDAILYFHGKNITRHEFYIRDKKQEALLYNWKMIMHLFMRFPFIDKIGNRASIHGWVWENCWWVRGSYLKRVEKPIITTRRHYYEDWLFRRVEKLSDMYPKEDRSHNNPCYFKKPGDVFTLGTKFGNNYCSDLGKSVNHNLDKSMMINFYLRLQLFIKWHISRLMKDTL